MTSDARPPESGKYLPTNAPEVNFALLLSGVIDSIKDNPAQLRNAIYELARVQLQREAWQKNPPMGILEMRRLMLALETAIERVETISSEQDRSPPLLGTLEPIETYSLAQPRQSSILIDQPALDTTFGAPIPAISVGHRSTQPKRHRVWHSLAPFVRGAVVGILVLIVYLVLDWHFVGFVRRMPTDPGLPAVNAEAPQLTSLVRPQPVPAQPAVPSLPRPSVYGVYAVSNGELTELEALSGRVPDPKVFMSAVIKTPSRTILADGRIVFIVYRRDIATSAPERVAIRTIAKIKHALTYNTAGRPSRAPLEDEWAIRNASYEFRVAPLSESPEMLVIRPELPEFVLPAGRYGLVLKSQAYDFTIAGPVTEPAQCLERIEAANGAFYSECPPS
jgi:hypothetical protein